MHLTVLCHPASAMSCFDQGCAEWVFARALVVVLHRTSAERRSILGYGGTNSHQIRGGIGKLRMSMGAWLGARDSSRTLVLDATVGGGGGSPVREA